MFKYVNELSNEIEDLEKSKDDLLKEFNEKSIKL